MTMRRFLQCFLTMYEKEKGSQLSTCPGTRSDAAESISVYTYCHTDDWYWAASPSSSDLPGESSSPSLLNHSIAWLCPQRSLSESRTQVGGRCGRSTLLYLYSECPVMPASTHEAFCYTIRGTIGYQEPRQFEWSTPSSCSSSARPSDIPLATSRINHVVFSLTGVARTWLTARMTSEAGQHSSRALGTFLHDPHRARLMH